MPFIGNKPADSFTSFAKQDFTTSATTSYTLDYAVANANEIALFINFVRQEPTTAYTATGTTLTLTSATSASDDMYAVFLGKAVQTVNPPAGSVGLSQLSATGTKDSTTFLRGDNTFASAGGVSTPYFLTTLSTSFTTTANTLVKVPFDNEIFDTDGCYDNSTNYRFTPTTAGKYFVFTKLRMRAEYGGAYANIEAEIHKNGSLNSHSILQSCGAYSATLTCHSIINMNGSTDYVEIYVKQDTGGNLSNGVYGDSTKTGTSIFGAYKLIG